MTILAIDYGEKRIGLAKSDELGMFAHGLGFIENQNSEYVLDELEKKCSEFRIQKIVIGLPKTMQGDLGLAAEGVLKFVESLKEYLKLEVVTWDERLTTKGANVFLI